MYQRVANSKALMANPLTSKAFTISTGRHVYKQIYCKSSGPGSISSPLCMMSSQLLH